MSIEDKLDKLVDVWKKNKVILRREGFSYESFIIAGTGWTHDEFVSWVANGRIPD